MSKVCQLSGKGPGVGNQVSHSERKTRRRFLPNVSMKTIIDPATGMKVRVKISTRAQRTFMKNPAKFRAVLKKLTKKMA
ncbi:50S ribosomal protein L28 [Candidatus Peregrinibacteria bacterium]|nr:50S ribosomal protein L28 [Candidatus Peregrinibacteria bacterium]